VRCGSADEDDPFVRLRRHRYGGLLEDLTEEPSLLVSMMFGFITCYLHGRLVLALADKRPPWRGLLVPTGREHHAVLRARIAGLLVHPVLGKWLYLPESVGSFEESAATLVLLARSGDPCLGVESAVPGRGGGRRSRGRTPARVTRRRSGDVRA
jgi:hypothetical protein